MFCASCGFSTTSARTFISNGLEELHGSEEKGRREKIQRTQIWQGCRQERSERYATGEERYIEIGSRRKRRHGEEPQTSDCDWIVRGSQKGGEGPSEEECGLILHPISSPLVLLQALLH